jgi:cellulose synthase/poly-beta-1,6-N-acetylglucosamine synthase-like glycosyltransferase
MIEAASNVPAGPALVDGPAAFTVSVIIPTRDRPDDLDACLDSIVRSCRTAMAEVIVVDDASTVPVSSVVRVPDQLRLRVIRNERPIGAAASRNAAATVATGDALAFLDDDARIPEQWFRVVQRELRPDRAAITGPVLGFDRCVVARARQQRYDRRYQNVSTGQAVDFLAGGNSVVWSHVFGRVGGFPVIRTTSDNAFVRGLHEIGYECHFVQDLTIAHRNSKGLWSAVQCAFLAGHANGAAPLAQRPPRPHPGALPDARSRDLPVAALNWLLNGCYNLGRACAGRSGRSSPGTPEARCRSSVQGESG